MIRIRQYSTPFHPGVTEPVVVTLSLPAMYKPLGAFVELLNTALQTEHGAHRLVVTSRVLEGPSSSHQFLVCQPGDTLPNVQPGEYDCGDAAHLQWSFWQGRHVQTVGHYSVFDVTNLKLKGYDQP